MKLSNNPAGPAAPASEEELDAWLQTPLAGTPYLPLLRLLAQACDYAVRGGSAYFTIGATKDRSAIAITAHQDGAKDGGYGATLGDASSDCARWL